jgi:protein disulfide-isomerase A6
MLVSFYPLIDMYLLSLAWCGHCKQLAPIYENVAKAFQLENNCVVANLDATVAEDVAGKYNVHGYPSLKFFKPDGSFIEYEGGRGIDDFVKYLNKQCGTHRNSDGTLNSNVKISSFSRL